MDFALFTSIIVVFELCVGQIKCEIGEWAEGDFGCVLDETSQRLQIAMVVDITESNFDAVNFFKSECLNILNALKTLNNEAEFAITTHANWPNTAFGKEDQETKCYIREVTFTKNIKAFCKTVNDINETRGSYAPHTANENALPAVAFTVTDKELGWTKGDTDEQGRNVHKIVILITDAYSLFELPTPGGRVEFKGDGSDTCQGSRPPKEEHVGRILEKFHIKMIGAYEDMNIVDYNQYADFFKKHATNVPYRSEVLYKFEQDIASYIKKQVLGFVSCYYEDPVGYNSLGL